MLDSVYCYVFNTENFSSVILNMLLLPLSVFFIVQVVFIILSELSVCLLTLLNIWNNYMSSSVSSTICISFDCSMILIMGYVFLLLCMPDPPSSIWQDTDFHKHIMQLPECGADHKKLLEGTA